MSKTYTPTWKQDLDFQEHNKIIEDTFNKLPEDQRERIAYNARVMEKTFPPQARLGPLACLELIAKIGQLIDLHEKGELSPRRQVTLEELIARRLSRDARR